jgi:hypothetical protein
MLTIDERRIRDRQNYHDRKFLGLTWNRYKPGEYTKEQYTKQLWISAKGNSKRKGKEFTIDIEDIKIPELCPFLGIPLTCIRGQGHLPTNASIDRIDSTKGYIKGNIQVISRKANLMKNNATKEQLIAFASGIMCLFSEGKL